MEKKITKREIINGLLNGTIQVTDEIAISYLENELTLLNKKSAKKGESKTQKENVGIKATIMGILAGSSSPMTATDVVKATDNQLTVQKVSALLKQLVEAGEVIKTVDKKQSLFSAVASAEVEGE